MLDENGVFHANTSDAKRHPMECPAGVTHIVSDCPVHDFRHINTLFVQANRALPMGGLLTVHFVPSSALRVRIFKKYPTGISNVVYFFHYIWKRAFPKIKFTRRFYFLLSGGKHRALPRVEVLGRLYRAGFKVVEETGTDNSGCVLTMEKVKEPILNDKPTYGPLATLRRIGYQGRMFTVYKFRTMYAYSEYIQDYMYETQGLAKGGKYKDDFRVNVVGKVLRKTFLDELPMFINLFKGDCKLVGVRPLSRSYFNLYTPEMQQLRTSVKPGLLPPFYQGKRPETLEEVMENERIYIENYRKHPFQTDLRYFWGVVKHVVFKRVKSS